MNSGDRAMSPNRFRKKTASVDGSEAETSLMQPIMIEKKADATIIRMAPRAAVVNLG